MIEQNKHTCKILVCPDCGRKYTAKAMEFLVFVPFNMKGNSEPESATGNSKRISKVRR
ncbi:MAG: hypothetical protein V1909_02660 [Candidatus Micrarchaeota archaeon]